MSSRACSLSRRPDSRMARLMAATMAPRLSRSAAIALRPAAAAARLVPANSRPLRAFSRSHAHLHRGPQYSGGLPLPA